MVHYSVLIPERDATGALARLLPPLGKVLDDLLLPYEIICIDDGSGPAAVAALDRLLVEFPALRVLRFDRPRGTSAALGAGLAAARGQWIFAWDAQTRLPLRVLPQLLARLSQHDLVFAEPERSLGAELCRPWARLPRLLAADAQLGRGEDLCWAARREAVAGLTLARGAFRVLPGLVASHGYRVCRLTIAQGLPPRGRDFLPGAFERLAVRWLDRHFEPHLAPELVRGDVSLPHWTLARGEVIRPRFMPHPAAVPVEKNERDSAQ